MQPQGDTRPLILRDMLLEAADPLCDTRSGEPYVFDSRGYVPFSRAATVLCLRRRPGGPRPRLLQRDELEEDRDGSHGVLSDMMGETGSYAISGEWQVLLGQAQVVNYIRSRSGTALRPMRYPGEFKLPGGAQDKGDVSLLDTACRELCEEFLVETPKESILLRPLRATQTRRIAGRSNLMFNFLAFADENPWLAELDVNAVNVQLARLESHVEHLLCTDAWAEVAQAQRQRLAPEMHRLAWFDFAYAIPMLQASIGKELKAVDGWQHVQFRRLGIQRRDPMSVTMVTLLEAERRATDILAKPRSSMDYEAAIQQESRRFSLNVQRLGRRRGRADASKL